MSWIPKTGTTFPADGFVQVAIASATSICGITQNGNVGYTSDGGTTWILVPSSNFGGVFLSNIVTNGTVFVIATDADAIFTSSDGGATWTNVTPVGLAFNGNPAVYYSPSKNIFIAFDGVVNKLYTSADGLAWTTRTTIDNALQVPFSQTSFLELSGEIIVVGGQSTVGASSIIVTTPDGFTWTTQLDVPANPGPLTPSFTNIAYNGTLLSVKLEQNPSPKSVDYVGTSSTSWAVGSSSNTPTVAPYYLGAQVAFGSLFVDGFYSDGFSVASSPDVVAWTPHLISVAGFAGADNLFVNAGRLYNLGSGIISTADLSTWVSELVLASGNVVSMAAAHGLFLAVGADDAGNAQVWFGSPGGDIPNVVGEHLPTASLAITNAGFTVGTLTFETSSIVAADEVISQTPVGGTVEAPGFAVNLVVSTGPAAIINKLTKKLLLYLHRIFDKDPHQNLAFRIQYDGTDLAWSILNGVMTLTATGGSGMSHTFSIANFTVAQLADFIAAFPGYSVPYQDPSSYAELSALVLLDSSNNINVSNGDHVYGYTTLLWAYLDSNSSEMGTAQLQIDNALQQMATPTAQDEWLDYQGSFYKVPRNQNELDPAYAPRIIANVLQPRGNNVAMASAIESIAQNGQAVRVIDAIDDTGFAITYNGLIHFDGSEFYDAGLGPNGAYGFFDVDFSYDFTGSVTQAEYMAIILSTVQAFRDAGTQLRAIIFRNDGSTTTLVSDSFIDGVRVIVYDDFSGEDYRLLETGLVRLLEDGTPRILES